MSEENFNKVMISIDACAAFVPFKKTIIKEYPDLFAEITYPYARRWRDDLDNYVKEKRFNGECEMTIRDPNGDTKLIQDLHNKGYDVNIKIMGTGIFESVPSVHERYEELLQTPNVCPRKPECISAFAEIPKSAKAIEEQGLVNHLGIYVRGQNRDAYEIYSNTNKKEFLNVGDAINKIRLQDDQFKWMYFSDRMNALEARLKARKASNREFERLKSDVEAAQRIYEFTLTKSETDIEGGR